MKPDYKELGQKAIERLKNTSENAVSIQKDLLAELIYGNRNTVYGRTYGFHRIEDAWEYQERVPVSVYEDYEDFILRIIDGEESVLTEEPAVYFCISSGTTGKPKYLPLTKTDLDIQYLYAYGLVFGMAGEYYRDLPETEVFGKIFQVGEFARTYMEDGRMNGIRSGALYQWLDRDGQFDASDYCVPKEVLFPDTLEDLLYVKVRFALAERNLCAIHGVFINRVSSVIDYIQRNWELLLRDIRQGSVDRSIALNGRWREYVRRKLPPNPLRAQELNCISREKMSQGIIEKIWPGIRYVLAIGGKTFPYYTDRMKEYVGGIPIYHYAYAASEGIFGVARNMDEADAYILFPEAGFFEFYPLSGKRKDNGRPCFLWELCKGERYELLFTNHSGLYRYCMGDVIEVIDWFGQAPVVKFCYRKNQVLNIAGERSNQEQLEEAVNQFSGRTGIRVTGYCVQEDVSDVLPRYLFYIEGSGKGGADANRILDDCLCRVNYGYQGCRRMNEIGEPQIAYLRKGGFERYEEHLAAEGCLMGQNKRLCILDTADKKAFFLSERE